ncbi:transcription factor domain-containing protein, partial [Aspergillus ambiguus]|uniref:transcription factor domain-containing protein n=1 Tax=Aspergillus ambiguus TaxID=176160 RepID=UPI003CCDC53C
MFLLSMIILGATYKDKDSHQLSVTLYDAIVPYILSGLMSIPIPDLSTLQAFLILECYGMYRAGPYQRENAILIHTLLFEAIRRVSRYHVRGGIMLPNRLPCRDGRWKAFAYAEQFKRLILFVFMWDTQNVSCYSVMPNMSTHNIQVPLPCAHEIWAANTEAAWDRAQAIYAEPPNFHDTVKYLVDGDDKHLGIPMDRLSLTLLLHGLMSMCNDIAHFDNRSIYLTDMDH